MAYKVIARKYRPQTFSEIVGQQHVTRTLANAIQSNRVAHAYIFSGVRGVGKTTAARILAKALNCVKGPTAEPDGTCDACVEIANGTSLDVLEIDAASNRGIDQIRELREMVRYAPASSRYKVVILDEAHQLTDEASNALLKTLEEPPERVVFILATTRAEDLVETIKSRAQLFQFRALSFQEIAGQIEHIAKAENLSIESGAVAVLARAAEGSLRDGLSLLEQAISYSGDSITDASVRELLGVVAESVLDDLVEAIAAQSADRALNLVHRLIADGQNLQHFCRESIRHFRNLLVTRVCGIESDLIAAPQDERPRLAAQAAQFGEEDLTRYFNILMATDDDLRRKPDPRLHLELGLLKMVNAQRLVPLEEVLAELRGEPRPAKLPTASSGSAASASALGATRINGPRESPAIRPVQVPPSPAPVPSASSAYAGTSNNAGDSSGKGGGTATAARMAPNTNPVSPEKGQANAYASPAPSRDAGSVVLPNAAEHVAENKNKVEDAAGHAVERAAEGAAERGPERSDAATVAMVAGNGGMHLESIKAKLQSSRLLSSFLEHAIRCQIEANEFRLFFSREDRGLSEMMSREAMERLRTAVHEVIGQPLRVCVKLEAGRAPVGRGSELRARFEEDPIVRAMLEKFGGQISNVKRPGEE